jgi:hypothetical protein
MREVESASRSAAASARLEEIRASLAISAPAPAELDEA